MPNHNLKTLATAIAAIAVLLAAGTACQNQATPAAQAARPGGQRAAAGTPGGTPSARQTHGTPSAAAATATPSGGLTVSDTLATDGVLALARPLVTAAFAGSGRVTAVHVAPGQAVRRGDMLAELDSTTLSTTLQQAQSALVLQQVQIEKGLAPAKQTDIDSARASLASAYAAYNELKKGPNVDDVDTALRSWNQAKNSLYSAQASRDEACHIVHGTTGPDDIKKAMLGSECKKADMNVQVSESSERTAHQKYVASQQPTTEDKLASAWSTIVQAQSTLAGLQNGASAQQKAVYDVQLAQARVAVDRAQRGLAQALLLSPCDCVVQAVGLSVGAVSGGSITLLDTSQVTFNSTNLSEQDVVKLHAGQTATLRLKAYAQTFTAKVRAILPLTSGTLGTLALYTAIIELDATQGNAVLLPGMTGQAEIDLK